MADEYLSRLRATFQSWFATQGGIEGTVITSPSAPSTGKSRLYPKSDGWYYYHNGGSETKLATTVSEGSDTQILFNDGGVRAGSVYLTFLKADGLLHSLIIDAGSGFTVNGAATTGNFLRGNGTLFISSTIAWADVVKTGSSLADLATRAASAVNTSVTNFGGKLSAADDTVQKALDTLDDHTHATLYAAIDHDATHITSGSDEIDGDKLDIDWNPANYTPALVTDYSTSLDHLTSHLKGIDTALIASEGSNTQILFNDSGARAGDSGLTFVKATDSLYVAGSLGVGAAASSVAKLYAYWNQTGDPGAHTYGGFASNRMTVASAYYHYGLSSTAYGLHTSGTVTGLRGYYGGVEATGSGGTTTYAQAVVGLLNLGSGHTIGTSASIFHGVLWASSATTPILYGLYLPNITGATTNWAIYAAGGASYHAGSWKQDAEHICKLISTPSSPASGYLDLYAKTDAGNSIQRFHRLTNAGAEVPIDGGYKAITSTVTIGNTATETVLVNTSISANAFEVGATYEIYASGTIVGGSAGGKTITFNVRIGTTSTSGNIITTPNPSITSGQLLTYQWEFMARVTVRTITSGGTAIGRCRLICVKDTGTDTYLSITTSTQTVDSTALNYLELCGKWGATDTGESINAYVAEIHRVV